MYAATPPPQRHATHRDHQSNIHAHKSPVPDFTKELRDLETTEHVYAHKKASPEFTKELRDLETTARVYATRKPAADHANKKDVRNVEAHVYAAASNRPPPEATSKELRDLETLLAATVGAVQRENKRALTEAGRRRKDSEPESAGLNRSALTVAGRRRRDSESGKSAFVEHGARRDSSTIKIGNNWRDSESESVVVQDHGVRGGSDAFGKIGSKYHDSELSDIDICEDDDDDDARYAQFFTTLRNSNADVTV